jgi:hypothetical protein
VEPGELRRADALVDAGSVDQIERPERAFAERSIGRHQDASDGAARVSPITPLPPPAQYRDRRRREQRRRAGDPRHRRADSSDVRGDEQRAKTKRHQCPPRRRVHAPPPRLDKRSSISVAAIGARSVAHNPAPGIFKPMLDVAGLTRVLLSLPDVELRVAWFRELLSRTPPNHAATLLNALCEDGERLDPAAREAYWRWPSCSLGSASASCSSACARKPRAASCSVWTHAQAHAHGSLEPRPSDPPVPDYGAGRELTVGERKSLARRPSRRSFEKLLRDPHPMVIQQLLQNPKLTEDDVIRLAAHRPARVETLTEIARLPRWLSRPRVRLTMLLNPGTPEHIAVPLLGACTRSELREVLQSADTPVLLRATAAELLLRRRRSRRSADATVH